jgi:competence protein ComEC
MAAMILAAMPLALFEPAFQLSFAGVIGILTLVPRWSRHLPRLPRPWRPAVQLPLATLAATLATCPLVLWHFHLLAPAGLLANLWAVPLIGFFAVPIGLTGMLLAPLWTAGAAACFRCVGATVNATLALSQHLLDCPLLAGSQLYLSPLQVAAVALLVITLLLPPARRLGRVVMIGLALVLLCWPSPRPAGLTVTALSVGQGDATLVTDRTGRHFLIDGGGLPHSRVEVGERLVAPALGYLGVDHLAAVVLSHDHPDHRDGLLHVLQHFPTGAFWSAMPPEKLWPPLRAVLRQRGIPIRTFAGGWQVVERQADRELAVFAPPQDNPKVNDRSLVFYARQGDNGVLLTGDLEQQGVSQLLAVMPPRPVSLLKLSHHGSRNSGYQQLLGHFAVRQAFASLGRHNRFGFPHAEVVQALQKRRLPLWRTDLNGTLRCSLQDSAWRIRYWQNGLFH